MALAIYVIQMSMAFVLQAPPYGDKSDTVLLIRFITGGGLTKLYTHRKVERFSYKGEWAYITKVKRRLGSSLQSEI